MLDQRVVFLRHQPDGRHPSVGPEGHLIEYFLLFKHHDDAPSACRLSAGINLMDGIQAKDLKGLAGAFSKAKQDPNMDPNNPDHVVSSCVL